MDKENLGFIHFIHRFKLMQLCEGSYDLSGMSPFVRIYICSCPRLYIVIKKQG